MCVCILQSAAGDDQSSEPTPSEKDIQLEEGEQVQEGEVEEEAEDPQEDYVNPDASSAPEAEVEELYDDVVTEPQKSESKSTVVPPKQPAPKKPKGGGKSELKDLDCTGYLNRKTTGIIKKWERKWFFIMDKTLYVSPTEEDESYKDLLSLANVSEVVKGSIEKQYPHGITLQLKPSCGKDIILAADSKEEQSLWVAKFNVSECYT